MMNIRLNDEEDGLLRRLKRYKAALIKVQVKPNKIARDSAPERVEVLTPV